METLLTELLSLNLKGRNYRSSSLYNQARLNPLGFRPLFRTKHSQWLDKIIMAIKERRAIEYATKR